MITPELLVKIKDHFNLPEQQVLLRSFLQNSLLEDSLHDDDLHNYFFEDSKISLSRFRPSKIGFRLLTNGENLKEDFTAYIIAHEEELSTQGGNAYQKLLLQKNYQPNIKDSLLISIFIKHNYLSQPKGNKLVEIIQIDEKNKVQIHFWGLVFACLTELISDPWSIFKEIVSERPKKEIFEIIIYALVANLMTDEEIEKTLSQILEKQKIIVCNQFLEILNRFGLAHLSQIIAESILFNNKIDKINLDQVEESESKMDLTNFGHLTNKLQNLGMLYFFAGKTDQANVLFDRAEDLLSHQCKILKKMQKEIKPSGLGIGTDFESINLTSVKEPAQKKKEINDDLISLPVIPIKQIEGLLISGKYSEAEEKIKLAKEYGKSDTSLLLLSAELNIVLGGYSNAQNEILIAQTLDPFDVNAQKLLAKANYLNGNFHDAYQILSSLYSKHEELNCDETEELCEYAIISGDYKNALSYAEKKIEEKKYSPNLLIIAAKSAFNAQDNEKAMNYLKRAIEIDKKQVKAWLLIADIQKKAGDSEKSLEALLTGQKYSPDSQFILFELLKIHTELGNNSKSLQFVEDILQAPLETIDLTTDMARFLIKTQKNEAAIQLLKNSYLKWPKSKTVYYELSKVLIDSFHFIPAIKFLEEISREQPLDNQGLRLYLLSLLNSTESIFPINASLTEENQEKVADIISQLQLSAPEDSWTRLFQAVYFTLQKKYSEAYDLYPDLIAKVQKESGEFLWKCQLGLGQVLLEIGKPESAITLFTEVLKENKSKMEVHQFLAEAYRACGLYDKALEIAWKALELSTNDEVVILWISEFIFNIDKTEHVVQYIKQKSELKDNKIQELIAWGYLEWRRGNTDQVCKILNSFRSREMTDHQFILLAKLYAKIKNFSEAANILKRIKFHPGIDRRKINLFLASLNYLQDNFIEAEKILKSSIDEFEEANLEKTFLIDIYIIEDNKAQLKSLLEIELFEMWIISILNNNYKDLNEVYPERWKIIIRTKADIWQLLVTALNKIGEYEKVLKILENYLSQERSNLTLVELAAKISKSLLLEEKTSQLILNEIGFDNQTFPLDGQNLDLYCLKIELALDRGEDLQAASLLNKIVLGNEENPRVKCIQSRLLLRQGDFENSFKIYSQTKSKDLEENIWFLDTAKEMGDYEEFFSSLRTLIEIQGMTPYLVLQYLKINVELSILDQQLNELKATGLTKGLLQEIVQLESKLSNQVIIFEEQYPPIFNWNALKKTLSGEDKLTTTIGNNIENLPFIAYLYRKTNNIKGLYELLASHENKADVHFQLGLMLAEENSDQSRDHFNIAISKNPKNPLFYAGLAFLEKKSSNPSESLKAIEKALAISPNEGNWHLLAFEEAETLGDWEKVILYGEKVIQNDPSNPSIINKMVKAHIQRNNILAAAKLIKKTNKGSFEETIILGKAALIEKNYKEVIQLANNAQKLKPDSSSPFILLSETALQLDQLEKAIEFSEKAIKCDPFDVNAHIGMSNALQTQKGSDYALDYLKSVLEKGIKSDLLLTKVVDLLIALKGSETALSFLMANYTEPSDTLLNQIAHCEINIGNLAEAERHAQESLLINPHQSDLYKLLGDIAEKKGNLDQAIKYFSEAILCDPKKSENYIVASKVYLNRREMIKALEVLDQGIKINSGDYRLYQNAGKIYWEIKDFTSAEIYFRQAHELNPEDQKVKRQIDIITAMNIINKKQEVRIEK